MKRSNIITKLVFLLAFSGTLTPIFSQAPGDPVYYEGKIYQTIIIGSQCWMTENLKVGSFVQGTSSISNNNLIEKYCYDNMISNCDSFGGLYPWNELMNYVSTEGAQGICPIGWHIPTKTDWNTLVGLYPYESSSDSLVWTGNTGFDALLGGYSNGVGGFFQQGIIGTYYSSHMSYGSNYRREFTGTGRVKRKVCSPSDAYSVRCVRDDIINTIPFSISLSTQDVSCYGGSDGVVLLSLAGVSNPSFLWSNGATTEDLYNMPAGTYSVTVTEGTQTLSQSITLNEASEIVPVLSVTSDIGCYNESDGSVEVTCTGGTPPYSYVWSTSDITSSVINIPAGTYSVTVFDSNNCQAYGEITVSNPALVIDFTTALAMPSCNGYSDGSIDITPIGSGYSYYWSNFQVQEDLFGLQAGNYSVTVSDTSNYCTVGNFEIVDPDPISIIDNITNASDQGLSDASIDITVSGGTPPYTYQWTNGATSEDIANIPAGSYYVTITDSNNCIFISDELLVTEPGIIINSQLITNVTCAGAQDGMLYVNASSASCSGYCLQYSIVNGETQIFGYFLNLPAGNYTMTITDTAGGLAVIEDMIIQEPDEIEITSIVEENGCTGANITVNATGGTGTLEYSTNGVDFYPSNEFLNLPSGTTIFYVEDANDCSINQSYTVSPIDPMMVSGTVSDVSCFGNSDGDIQVSVTNGEPPYSFNWSNGSTGSFIYNIPAGNYIVTVSDNNSCAETSSFTVDQPGVIQITLSGTDVSYPSGTNGLITTSISGGFPPYTYNWSNSSTLQNISGLQAGNYVLTLSDSYQCSSTASIEISESYVPISIGYSTTDVTCYGGIDGTSQVMVNGGNAPYTYLWSTGAVTQSISGLSAGTYTVTVTGYYGMTGSENITISEPSAVSGIITVLSNYNSYDVSCNLCADGQVSVSAQGGASPYTYNWSNGSTNQVQNSLSSGTHYVTITDMSGCQNVESVSLDAPPALQLSVAATSNYSGYNVSCVGSNDGSAIANVSGGVPPYSYNWNSGATTAIAENLTAQVYFVTVTDLNNASISGNVILSAPAALSMQINSTDNLCYGDNNGVLTVAVSGGITPYFYAWSNGATGNITSNLVAGYYTLTVTDDHNCQSTSSRFINQPPQIELSANITDNTCFGGSNGAIDLNITGGVAPFSVQWTNNATTEDISNLSMGSYSVAVTDYNNCIKMLPNLQVLEPTELISTLLVTPLGEYGSSDGAIDLFIIGGTPPYSFLWSNGATTQNIENLSQAMYYVTISDSENCIKVDSANVNLPAGMHIIDSTNHVTCNGFSDGEIFVSVYGGIPPYNYQWSTGASSDMITGLFAALYYITVTDFENNIEVDSILVSEPSGIDIALISTPASCYGGNDGSVEAAITGGTPPYYYGWSNGGTMSVNSGLAAGVYGFYVTDSNNCMSLTGVEVSQPTEITVVQTLQNATDIGLTNGSASLDVSGGTAPYTFLWSNGNTSSSHNALGAGIFYVLVKDASSCELWINFEIFDDPALIVYGCTDPLALNYDPLANTSDGSCIYIDNPPNWSYVNTGISHSILLPAASQITISEIPIEPGDYLGVFYDSLGTLACGGYIMWMNNNLALTAWGDDQVTISDPDGFAIGEEFKWKVWDASDSTEYDAIPIYELTGFPDDAFFAANGMSSLNKLTAIASETQDILLLGGWDYISTYIDPFEPDIANVLSPIIGSVEIVKDSYGNIYWPQWGVNLIGDMTIGEGYHINMSSIQILSITGIPVSPEEVEIPLPLGWSLMGYLRKMPAALEYLLTPVKENIIIMKDGGGAIYWPIWNVNNIGDMIPGEGYSINMAVPDTLIYPANFTNVAQAGSKSYSSLSKEDQIQFTDNNMTLGIPLRAWDELPVRGDEIYIYSESGELVGGSVFTGNNTAITLWGNDKLSLVKDGLSSEEKFEIFIESTHGQKVQLHIADWEQGSNRYSENAISIAGKIYTLTDNQSEVVLMQNIPNPFISTTTIEFTLPEQMHVRLEIYNELGELITTPVNNELCSGEHSILFDGKGLPAGIYFYTIRAGDLFQSYQMNLLK